MDTARLTQADDFVPYEGDMMGLCVNDTHLVYQWIGPGKVLFSVSRRGDAAACHFASDKAGLRHLRHAIDAFCRFVFWLFDWCTMILAQVEKSSVGRLIEQVGFEPVAQADGMTIYMRAREWAA